MRQPTIYTHKQLVRDLVVAALSVLVVLVVIVIVIVVVVVVVVVEGGTF